VGDKETDIQAGIAAGVGVNLLYCPLGSDRPMFSAANAVIDSFADITTVLHHEIDRATL